MTNTIDKTPCPQCGMIKNDRPVSRTGMYINVQFVASSPWISSLSGTQIKTTGKMFPVLKCRNCPFELVGELDGEGYAVFKPLTKGPNSATQDSTIAPTT